IRSDIYSLGCTLYFMLTGQRPFPEGTVAQKLAGHRERSPQSLRELRPDAPAAIARIMDRMMAKDPAQRYQTPAEVARALAPFASERRFSARMKWLALAAGVILIVAASVALRFGVAPWLSSRTYDDLASDGSASSRPARASALPAHFALQV